MSIIKMVEESRKKGKLKLKFEDLELVDESQVPIRTRSWEYLDLFKKIDKGKALAIPAGAASASTLREAVKRLVQTGQLPSSYKFTVRKDGDGKEVSYIINSAEIGSEPSRTRIGSKVSFDTDKVESFILSQPNYAHNLQLIQKHFLGKILSSREDESDYHRTYNMARRARESIEKRVAGKFKEEIGSDGVKMYRFHKNV